MKKVAFFIATLITITAYTSCKDKQTEPETTEDKDLAVADTTPEITETDFYVTAPSGLTLREFNNLNSEKLAIMPYGTKVKVITSEKNLTMTVGGIKGGMNEVEFNNKKGFAFNGFLSKFFPPEKGAKAKMYVEDLQKKFPTASYAESSGGTASNPSNTETVVLPTENWHDGFYIAQKLYKIPGEFSFPNPKGKDKEILTNSKKTPTLWVSDLAVERMDDTLQKITYTYAGEGYSSSVTITKEGENIKIEKTEVAD